MIMSTNHTPNYQLSQWEPSDQFVRTDFNEDNAKIDSALKANADAVSMAAQANLWVKVGEASLSSASRALSVSVPNASQFRELRVYASPKTASEGLAKISLNGSTAAQYNYGGAKTNHLAYAFVRNTQSDALIALRFFLTAGCIYVQWFRSYWDIGTYCGAEQGGSAIRQSPGYLRSVTLYAQTQQNADIDLAPGSSLVIYGLKK